MKEKIIKMLLIGAIICAYKVLYAPEEMSHGKEKGEIKWVEPSRGWDENGTNLWTAVSPLPNYNVGIGTSTPLYKLDVVGNVRFQGSVYINSWPISVTAAPPVGYVLKWTGSAFTPQPDAGVGDCEWLDAGSYLYPRDQSVGDVRVYEDATSAKIYAYQTNASYVSIAGAHSSGPFGQLGGSSYGAYGQYNSSIYGFIATPYSGIQGNSNNTQGAGVMGIGAGTIGVYGESDATTYFGVVGWNTNASGTGILAAGNNVSATYLTSGSGVAGTGTTAGIFGTVTAGNGVGIVGADNSGSIWVPSAGAGVAGSGDEIGVVGYNTTNSAATYGYLGGLNDGVFGVNTSATQYNTGVAGFSNANNTIGVAGQTTGAPSVCVLGTDGPFYWSSHGPVGISAGSNNSFGAIIYSVNGQTAQFFIENTQYFGIYGSHASIANGFHVDFDGYVFADGYYTPGLLSNGELVILSPLLAVDESRVVLFGRGKISGGIGEVKLDRKRRELLSETEDYHIFLTPLGETNGLCVVHRDKSGFKVKEVANGRNTLEFDYMIVGIKKGAEDIQKVKDGYLTRMRNTERLLATLKKERIDKSPSVSKHRIEELSVKVANLQKELKKLQGELERVKWERLMYFKSYMDRFFIELFSFLNLTF